MVIPFNHQKKFLDKNLHKALLCWGTGSGKTLTSILWANQKGDSDTLYVCPKALKENWQRNTKEHGKWFSTILTKEEFWHQWDTLKKFNTIVIDEAHYFAGMKSEMSKRLWRYIKKHNVQNVLLLTATPYLSSPWNIYTLASFLGREWNYMKFEDKFFDKQYIAAKKDAKESYLKKKRRQISVVKKDIEADVAWLVAQIGDVVRLDECADVPEQIFDSEIFELTEEQIAAKREVVEVNPMVRYTKYHQIENGTIKGDEYVSDRFVESNKTERIKDLCSQNDKTIIICRYNLQIDFYMKELADLGKPLFMIRGDVKNRDEVIQGAEKAEKGIVIINAACSEGFELPSYPLMLFASMSFSYKDYKQMVGRILRINRLKKNVYIHLVTRGIDTAVYNAIMKKQDFDIEIYARNHEEEVFREGLSDRLQ